MNALSTSPSSAVTEPAFVPLSILPEPMDPQRSAVVEVSQNGSGVMTIEVGPDVVLRLACDVAVERAAALTLALRGAA